MKDQIKPISSVDTSSLCNIADTRLIYRSLIPYSQLSPNVSFSAVGQRNPHTTSTIHLCKAERVQIFFEVGGIYISLRLEEWMNGLMIY